ncbi:MAG: serine hydrolase [Ignavibacteriales bacterium]|nr:serine hydrolase [Ignavibacteriales bacterium]
MKINSLAFRLTITIFLICNNHDNGVAQEFPKDHIATQQVSDTHNRHLTTPSTSTSFNSSSNVDSFIIATMNSYHIPGVSACIIKDGNIVWIGAYGYADIERNIKVTDSTLFLVASLSKPVTATALMQLWESGRFKLDEDVNHYLPFQVRNPLHPNDSITFRMLLTHTSGINDNWLTLYSLTTWGGDSPIPLGYFLSNYLVPAGAYWSDTNYTSWAPLQSYIYTNVGATLIGGLVETITNIPFEQYCHDSIFIPLGMNNTSFFLSNLDTNNIALPYNYSGGVYTSYGHYGNPIYPAAHLRTSAPQLARFLIAFMQKGQMNGVRILDSSTVELMTTVQFPALQNEQGLIWFIYSSTTPGFGTYTFCGHNGSYPGIRTGMDYTLETDKHIGVVVLTNGESDAGRNIIWDALYRFGDTLQTDVADDFTNLPGQFYLSNNYPNPFNPSTTIGYELPIQSHVTLKIYDVIGREVATLVDEMQQAGNKKIEFDADHLTSGVYFYSLHAGTFVETKKLLLLR